MPVPDAALPGGAESEDADGEGGAVRIAVRGMKGSDPSTSSDPDRPGSGADPADPGRGDPGDAGTETSLIDVTGLPAAGGTGVSPDADPDAGSDVEEPTGLVRTVEDPAIGAPAGAADEQSETSDDAAGEPTVDVRRDGPGGDATGAEEGASGDAGPGDASDTADADTTRAITADAVGPVARTAVGRSDFDEATGSYVVQDGPAEMTQSELRVDFGAHLEANYQRLVAQLYAITLSSDQAHTVVQDAYSRAWRNWSIIGRSADPTAWVRRVAVRTTMRSWRHLLARLGLARPTPPVAGGLDERTTELLTALRNLSAPERRAVVLFHMAGLSITEIASVEQVSPTTVSSRLDRGRRSVLGNGDGAGLLSGEIDLVGVPLQDDRGYVDEMTLLPPDGPAGGAGAHLDDRWERADAWNGGPDGSWPVSEAPPWEMSGSDPWPGRGAPETTERISEGGDAPLTSDGPSNTAPGGDDDRAWTGTPSQDGGVLLDEYDTVAPDGTLVAAAANPPEAERDAPSGIGVRPGGGVGSTGREQGTERDSEDRR
ncbi:MAG: RNA polymerase sigma factor [Pseudonocardia sp.]